MNETKATNVQDLSAAFRAEKTKYDKGETAPVQYSRMLANAILEAHKLLRVTRRDKEKHALLLSLATELVAEWNRVPIPDQDHESLRWRAKWNLLYLNNDTHMADILAANRMLQYRNPDNKEANERLGWSLLDVALYSARAGRKIEAERFLVEFDRAFREAHISEGLKTARLAAESTVLRSTINPTVDLLLRGTKQQAAKATERLLAVAGQDDHFEAAIMSAILDALRELAGKMASTERAMLAFRRNVLLFDIYPSLASQHGQCFDNSLVLRYAIRLFEDDPVHFLRFLDLWDLDSIRPEDYDAGRVRDGRRYKSLVGLLLPAMSRAVRAARRLSGNISQFKTVDSQSKEAPQKIERVIPRIAAFSLAVYERFPDDSVYAYHSARILAATGSQRKSREILSRHAGELGEKWWYWKVLAETCAPEEGEVRLRFLCKACVLRTRKDQDFMGGVFREIGTLLRARGLEISPSVVRSFAEEAWGIVSTHKVEAEAVLLKVSRTLRAFAIHALAAIDGGLEEVGGTVESSFLEKSVRGDAVTLGLLRTPSGWRIIEASARSGDKWDVLPWHSCIVVSSRAGRSVWNVYSETGEEFRVPVASWKGAAEWAIGKALRLKYIIQQKRYFIVAEEKATETPDFVQVVAHKVERVLPGGNAKLPQGIHLPRRIAAPMGIKEGDTVKVTLVPRPSPERRVRVIDATRI